MRGFLWLIGATAGSVAFQVSVSLWPGKFAHYAWLVPYVWMVWGVIFLSLLITHEKVLGKKLKKLWGIEDDSTMKEPLTSGSAPIAIHGESRPHIEVNPTFVPIHASESVTAQQQAPLNPPPQKAKAGPNLISLGGKTTQLQEGKNRTFYEAERSNLIDKTDPYAVIASFRNEPIVGQKVTSVYARACLVFRDNSGKEIGEGVSRACWLGDSVSPTVEFLVGESHKVILGLLLANGALICPYRQITQANWGNVVTTEGYPLGEDLATIEVRIVRENELLLEPIVFDFSIVDERPVIRRR